ncbi:MAG: thermonuclease family protein [Planctomycetes bacterium]|nr:thermonuclease family protein [Planctomycetota bacterium]
MPSWQRGWPAAGALVSVALLAGCVREEFEIAPDGSRRPVAEPEKVPEPPDLADLPRHRIAEVPSGDTIVLSDGRTVRYIGVQAPRAGEAFFEESRRAHERVILEREVVLVYDQERIVEGVHQAYVYAVVGARELQDRVQAAPDGGGDRFSFVNMWVIHAGLARAAHEKVNTTFQYAFSAWEERAKEEGVGIWQR